METQPNISNSVVRFDPNRNSIEKFNGPISASLAAKAFKIPSAFPDRFDYSVYDSLFLKFGENQPRGGVVFRSPLRLVNYHGSCTKCHYALELDTYGRGCTFNCVYCYANEQLTAHGYWNRPHPFPADFGEIRKIFSKVFETDQKSKWRSILEKKIPIRLGSMTDCFMKLDRRYRVTYELLKLLRFYRYPYIIFTRSDLVADPDYMEQLDRDLSAIQFSISGNNETITRKVEPGAPSITARLRALETLNKSGFWTTVRINPLFPTHPDGYFTDRSNTVKRFGGPENIPTFPLFNLTLLDMIKEAGVPSVLAGVVRLSPIAVNQISKATGIDLKVFFNPELHKGAQDRKYSEKEVTWYYRIIYDRCRQLGLRFNTCYIGNGIKDYFVHQSYWSNLSDCCDVRGNVPGFQRSAQEISWAERMQHCSNPAVASAAMQEERNADVMFCDGRSGSQPRGEHDPVVLERNEGLDTTTDAPH